MGSLTTEKSGLPIGWLYASVAAVAYVYSLDQNITPNYLPIAASAYGKHSSIGTIFTVESIINGVSKPFIAKIADVISRPSACMCSLVFYTAGYLMIALSSSITHVITGCMLYTVGHSGLNLVTDIIVADISSLKWRGFVLSLTGLPFLVNTFIGAEIVNAVLKRNAWRWGYGMFVIILPVVTLPRYTSSITNTTTQLEDEDGTYWNRLKNVIVRMDFGGLVLIGISFSLLLLPLTLAKSAQRDWTHPSMLVMTVLGVLFISVFMLNERLWTQYPLFPSRFIRNRTLLIIIFIDFLYFMSGWMRTNYLSSYVYIVKDWTPREWSYFNNATTFSLCILGPVAGLIQRYTHRYKTLQVTGLSIRLMQVASQVLIGAGGAFNVAGSRVASQASVPHTDLASVVAILALCTQFGSATGSATATKLWRTTLVPCLIKYLPWLTNEEIQELFGSISKVRQYPYNDPVRQGVIKG
ncbi:major facilitator superfamily domain-containing protein [Cantharellus anzutake]|uniref:major facilitator superfamily domain-containing protein n=1 Tax=Cantharellus anzutake TaxID=1750568 RepID=UPI0019054CEB|nr:major facilitator superfamily domain-containing protein [Cantharellus anzutake]KAF8312904.1 major facilitator superfamily domain-containing protein [Cantharellus anzutake]